SVSAVAVKRISYRSAAMGRTVDRAAAGVQDEVASAAIRETTSSGAEDRVAGAGPTSGAAPIAGAAPIVREAPIGGTVASAALRILRTDALTSGSGKRAAIR